jgi:hypothetical protein
MFNIYFGSKLLENKTLRLIPTPQFMSTSTTKATFPVYIYSEILIIKIIGVPGEIILIGLLKYCLQHIRLYTLD